MAHPLLIDGLSRPQAYPHPVQSVRLIETHISSVFLTGRFAYKVKKPVALGFLDYRRLEDRKRYCEEELRLDRRLAPQLYLEVVAITGSEAQPRMGGAGEPLEYAVKMREFDQADLLPEHLARGDLSPTFWADLARRIARFHETVDRAPPDNPWGAPESVYKAMTDNFAAVRQFLEGHPEPAALRQVEAWTQARYQTLKPLLEARRREGFIRECHGDMHLGNMALLDGEVAIFDGIEFNPAFRWIDIHSELAFLLMDLDDRGAREAAHIVLNTWLQATGDYAGLPLLRFYQAYRAMVRAKVEAIRSTQPGLSEAQRERHRARCDGYVTLAARYTQPSQRFLAITCGVSGSGKSQLAERMAQRTGGIWLRSDVERKRLFGLPPLERAAAAPGHGIYTPEAGEKTYAALANLAATALQAGFPVIVDATFLDPAQRAAFRELASHFAVPFRLLWLEAAPEVLHARVRQRARTARDPSDADERVLESQLLRRSEPLPEERPWLLRLDSSGQSPEQLAESAMARLRIAAAGGGGGHHTKKKKTI